MGWGDEIMVTAEARALQAADPRRVAVRGKRGEPRWHEIWQNNPRIATPAEVAGGLDVQWLDNYGGHRPYLDYARFKPDRYAYTDYRVERGEIYLSESERAWAAGLELDGSIVIEPTIKRGAPVNKAWGDARWLELVKILRGGGAPLVQLGPDPGVALRGVRHVLTRTVREAAAALERATVLVTVEGGLHHCAAALGVRAVVIFGGYISPATTGYASHVNLFTGGKACGNRRPCAHCGEAMAKIRPAEVARLARLEYDEARAVQCS